MAARPRQIFYTQVTPVKQTYMNDGRPQSVDVPLITLPPGTLLFRGARLPKPEEDVRYFYRDYLGDPEGAKVCLSPKQNVFFYPAPVAFGVADVGKRFNSLQLVVLVHPITVICLIGPSPWVRGIGKRFGGEAPFQRCSTLPYDCHELSGREKDALEYDNCLNPSYQVISGTRGWMAIANQDSINPRKKAGAAAAATEKSQMAEYLRGAEARVPGTGSQLIANSYTDDIGNVGFPEIALYPYKEHKGPDLLTRPCKSEDAAIKLISDEAAKDNLNYLPLAVFTKDGMVDMTNGYFKYGRLDAGSNVFTNAIETQQALMEQHLQAYMDKLQSEGLSLPFYRTGKLSFDTRTGFYVFPQMVPANLKIRSEGEEIPYKELLLALSTPAAKAFVLNYLLKYRAAFTDDTGFMKRPAADAIRQAMIFNRPADLSSVFANLSIPLPPQFVGALQYAARLLKSGRKTVAPAAQAAVKTTAPQTTVKTAPRNLPSEFSQKPAAQTGPLALPSWSEMADNAETKGGSRYRKTRSNKSKKGTRRNVSASQRSPNMRGFKKLVNSMWKAHAGVKKRLNN